MRVVDALDAGGVDDGLDAGLFVGGLDEGFDGLEVEVFKDDSDVLNDFFVVLLEENNGLTDTEFALENVPEASAALLEDLAATSVDIFKMADTTSGTWAGVDASTLSLMTCRRFKVVFLRFFSLPFHLSSSVGSARLFLFAGEHSFFSFSKKKKCQIRFLCLLGGYSIEHSSSELGDYLGYG